MKNEEIKIGILDYIKIWIIVKFIVPLFQKILREAMVDSMASITKDLDKYYSGDKGVAK